MRNKKHVAELLAALREECTNDFERRRVEVLAQDLSEPPQVQIVDDTHQRFNGVTYSKDPSGHYRVYNALHQAVFFYSNGEIPDGYDIHHIDCDAANNDISNLQLVTPAEHKKLHANLEPKVEMTCIICGKKFMARARQPSKVCSEKCRRELNKEPRQCVVCGETFLVSRYDKTATCSSKCANVLRQKAVRPKITLTCQYCGKEFSVISTGRNKYCSRKCGQRAAYEAAMSTRICAYCGKEFKVVAWADTKCCSHECANALIGRSKEFSHEKRICPTCGKTFEVYKSAPKKYCSQTCYHRARSAEQSVKI